MICFWWTIASFSPSSTASSRPPWRRPSPRRPSAASDCAAAVNPSGWRPSRNRRPAWTLAVSCPIARKQLLLVAVLGQRRQLHAAAIGGQAADDPASRRAEPTGRASAPLCRGFSGRESPSALPASPTARPRRPGPWPRGQSSAPPLGQGYEPLAAQAPQARDPVEQLVREPLLRQPLLQGGDHLGGASGSGGILSNFAQKGSGSRRLPVAISRSQGCRSASTSGQPPCSSVLP